MRQCGKTTLLQTLSSGWRHFDLERRADHQVISRDPDAFLRLHPRQVAMDEAQVAPEIFAALRVAIDEQRAEKGRFVITGSSSPALLRSVSESLAGRVGIIEMAPFSWEEVTETGVIRTLAIGQGEGRFEELLTQLKDIPECAGLWTHDSARGELRFHPKLLPVVFKTAFRIRVKYHEQNLAAFSLDALEWRRDLLAEIELSRPAVQCWQQIYLEQRDAKEAFRALARDYPLTPEYPPVLLQKESQLLRQIGMWEQLEVKFPEPLF